MTRIPSDLESIIHGALVEIGTLRPSPDWDNDPRAAHLLTSLPRFCRHLRLAPPVGMDPDDWISDLRLTLIIRSRSMKSRWNPARGKSTPSSWAAQVLRSRSQNLWRNERLRQSRVGHLPSGEPEQGIESYGGAAVWR